jgi:DICT domain-containing protein/GGDEF domain-containing protein
MAAQDRSVAGPIVKKTLVSLSHAIEQAALSASGDGPVVVVALFQRLPFFDRERETYSRLAANADVVVVGFVDDFRPALSGRIHPVLLTLDEPLAREWTVVVATPQMGAYLIAYDEETVAPGERTLEAGRLFSGRWGFSRAGAHAEVRRLRAALADRLPPGALAVLDQVATSAPGPVSAAEDRADPAMRLLVTEMEQARRRGVDLRDQLDAVTLNGDRDLSSQLYTPAFLRRWVGSNRTTTAGPLPLALVLMTIPELAGISRYGTRAEREVMTAVAATLTRLLRPMDRAVRLGEAEFLLVAPGGGESEAADLVRLVTAEIEQLGNAYPFVPMRPVSAVTVTRQRPLPLEELQDTVRWARTENFSIAILPS